MFHQIRGSIDFDDSQLASTKEFKSVETAIVQSMRKSNGKGDFLEVAEIGPNEVAPAKRGVFGPGRGELLHGLPLEGRAIGVKDLEVMDAGFAVVGVGPDELLGAGDFEELDLARSGVMAGDDGIAIRQALTTTGVVDRFAGEIIVAEFPDGLALGVDFNYEVAQGTADEGIAIGQADGGEGPVGCFDFPDDLAFGGVFADDLVKELGDEIVAIGELATHAGLQVMIIGLRLERYFNSDFALGIDLEQARFGAGLGEEHIPIVELLHGIHFGLGSLEGEDFLAIASDLGHTAAGVFVALVQGEQDVAVG